MELRSRLRRKRVLIPVATIVGLVVAAVILRSTDLIVPVLARPGASNVPTIPPCNGHYLLLAVASFAKTSARPSRHSAAASLDLAASITWVASVS
jgi:hypothetical protein